MRLRVSRLFAARNLVDWTFLHGKKNFNMNENKFPFGGQGSSGESKVKSKYYLNISPIAEKRLREILKPDRYFRVSIVAGGCNGFRYSYEVVSKINDDDHFGCNGVVIDNFSIQYLNGSTLNYDDSIMRSGFSIGENPNTTRECSCGTSFDPFLNNQNKL